MRLISLLPGVSALAVLLVIAAAFLAIAPTSGSDEVPACSELSPLLSLSLAEDQQRLERVCKNSLGYLSQQSVERAEKLEGPPPPPCSDLPPLESLLVTSEDASAVERFCIANGEVLVHETLTKE